MRQTSSTSSNTCPKPPTLEGTLWKAEQSTFCTPNLLTTTAQQPFPTHRCTEAVHRPDSSPCVYCQTQGHCFCFCPLFWGAPIPLLLFLKHKQGKGVGGGWTRDRGAQERRWAIAEQRGRGLGRSRVEGRWREHSVNKDGEVSGCFFLLIT